MDKISSMLRDKIDACDANENLDIIVELQPLSAPKNGSRSERITALHSAFEVLAAPVKSTIEKAGGTLLGEVWLNQTLRCLLPARKIDMIGELDEVIRLGVPDTIVLLKPASPSIS